MYTFTVPPPIRKSVVLSVLAAVLVMVTLPYMIAASAGGSEYVFGGFLLNPLDGNSYLAKMYQGWSGAWQFTLPFTADPGQGAYLFLFYLFLGHLARWTGLSLLMVFHLARVIAGILLVLALAYFFPRVMPEGRHAGFAFALAALGSGLGWLAVALGGFTSDFWVAEAYPFLSFYANPHFPLAMAISLWLLASPGEPFTWLRAAMTVVAGLLLGILLPFAAVIVGLVLVALAIWNWLAIRRLEWRRPLFLALGGAAPLIYALLATRISPQLSAWNRQNVTPAPAIWDLIVSLSPALFLAVPGAVFAARRKEDGPRMLVCWAVIGLILLYLPWSLQRRFMFALYVPMAGLAVLGVSSLAKYSLTRFRLLATALFLLALPTNLVVILAGLGAARSQDTKVFISRWEMDAFRWLAQETPQEAVVLSSPETGALIPAYSGRRVVYGHPFETVNALNTRAEVLRFVSGQMTSAQASAFFTEQRVSYIFWGPRELADGWIPTLTDLRPVYQNGGVTIFAVRPTS